MILLVTSVTTRGGVWRHVCDVAVHLRARGYVVKVAVPPPLRPDLAALGVNVHEGRRFPRGAICHFHLADTFDRVLLQQMVVARLSGCRLVVSEHLPRTDASDTSLTYDRRRLGAWSTKTVFKTIQFDLVAATIAVSESAARFLAVRYGRQLHEIDVVRNGVEHLTGAGFTTAAEAAPVVAAAGAMLRQKGFDVLIRAVAASAGDWQLHLAGVGPHFNSYRKLITELGLWERVRLLGWQDSVRELFRDSRVVAVPSRWEAAAPYVVLEAMSECRPVVATRFDGVDEVVIDGVTGLLVERDDHQGLAVALDELVVDAERCVDMGWAARRHVDGRTDLRMEFMIDGLVAVYERVGSL